jgi:hypothetical protein
MTSELIVAGDKRSLDDVGITVEQILAAAQADDYIGFCVACGAEHYGVEPDARKYPCQDCGKLSVYGAEDLLIGMD